ncbi:flagellar protein FlaG [Halalkalibacter urbisdiaboli]|uniref:flagellar protein FlaG n=1 Tax=Halalkalibacter urbisdiaboli TaxID=1960589 RepID=UPI000B44F6EA|nr:flagellar protein FlaG [Halalkalibacter urbisdiaboli]
MEIGRSYASSSSSYVQQNTRETNYSDKESISKSEKAPSFNEVEQKLESVNSLMKSSNSHLKFQLHEELKEYYVTIVDEVTNEVIKEIPSKKLLDMHAVMLDMIGIMIDKKI